MSKYVGSICELLGDANGTVRSAALECLVEIYRHVGVKVRIDLSKRNLPPNKLQMVLQKFDEVDGEKNGRIGDDVSSFVHVLSSSPPSLPSSIVKMANLYHHALHLPAYRLEIMAPPMQSHPPQAWSPSVKSLASPRAAVGGLGLCLRKTSRRHLTTCPN